MCVTRCSSLVIQLFVSLFLSRHRANAGLLGAILSPHGGSLLSPGEISEENSGSCTSNGCGVEAQARCSLCGANLHNASIAAARDLASLGPNLVILTTPHSEAGASDTHVIYAGGSILHGESRRGSITAKTSNSSERLVEYLQGKELSIDVATVSKLQWAEYIPLWFLPSHLRENVIIIAVQGDSSCALGQQLLGWLNSMPDVRALWIVSGDMSHYHGDLQGCAGAPYEKSADAAPFEAEMQCWASSLKKTHLDHALRLNAGSCAADGVVALDCGLRHSKQSWSPCVRGHGVCTYFGMMVASFTPVGTQKSNATCLPCSLPSGSSFLSARRRPNHSGDVMQARLPSAALSSIGQAFVQTDAVRMRIADDL